MERRRFLTGAASGAVAWLAAGRIPGTGETPRVYADPLRIIPRAEAAETDHLFVIDQAATAARQAQTYPQSVASGDPNPNGAVLWTRVDPSAIVAGQSTLSFQVGTSAGFEPGSIILQGTASISSASDNTITLPVVSTALSPFTVYYYQFIYNGIASRTGRFKTLPAPGDALSQLVIGTANCQDYSNGLYTAWSFLAQENLDVVLYLGDYIYEYRDDGVGGANNGPVRIVPPFPSGSPYPSTVDDYRFLYQTYRADPNLQAAHENFAFIFMWDDHEFFNDCHQDFHPDTDPAGVNANTPQPALRAAATQAWKEYCPSVAPYNPAAGWEDQVTVYRSFNFGTLAHLVITDERLYRDGPPCGSTEIGGRYFTTGCSAQSDKNRTMLGSTQKSWFLNEISTKGSTWTLWGNEVMCAQYKYGVYDTPAAVFFDLDAWDGYIAERTNILNTAAGHTRNFVALSGDAHLFMASYLKANFSSLLSSYTAVEFLTGPISSGNYLDAGVDAPDAAPLSSPHAARYLAKTHAQPLDTLEPVVLLSNPHMQYWNGSSWGYGVVTVTPSKLTCTFKGISTIKQAGGTLYTLASFTVPEGKVQINGSGGLL